MKIGIITSTRAEYGLLKPVIEVFRTRERVVSDIAVSLIVTGTHLCTDYGHTIDEIINDGLRIDFKVPVRMKCASYEDISINQADILVKFTDLLLAEHFDSIVILGDRYEMLAIAIAATNTRTPIIHLCGGDTTEAAIDECIRHSITKMSALHFVTNNLSEKRVLQLGENPECVFNYGSTSIDNILHAPLMTSEDALKSIGLYGCKYAVGTYHPVTLDDMSMEEDMREFLRAIEFSKDIEFIVTKSNADKGGQEINKILDKAEKRIKNLHVYTSLGMIRYLSLVKGALFVIGNSSSGIIEAPALRVPTINIGDRQRGRLSADSVINCQSDFNSIMFAIQYAQSDELKIKCKEMECPYGDGNAAGQIVDKSIELLRDGKIKLMKSFHEYRG